MRRGRKQEGASGCLLLTEEREQLLRDLERYRALLGYTTDEQAIAALEQLIREIHDLEGEATDIGCEL